MKITKAISSPPRAQIEREGGKEAQHNWKHHRDSPALLIAGSISCVALAPAFARAAALTPSIPGNISDHRRDARRRAFFRLKRIDCFFAHRKHSQSGAARLCTDAPAATSIAINASSPFAISPTGTF